MKPITIIGGGLAGLSLGIALRQLDVPVTIKEAGHFPRHRVCGEFISGMGLDAIEELGLQEIVQKLSVETARDAAFFHSARAIGQHQLPRSALCVSRYALDAALSRHFQRIGGELCQGERYRGTTSPGFVWATGRRAQPTERGWRWFGLKVHARGVSLAADLEMHLSKNAYVGLCRLANGEVNVCGLFRRRINQISIGQTLDSLRGEAGSQLSARLQDAEFDEKSFCAVAGLSLQPQAVAERECRIGDALTMIPPITGNGMSMAFESARMAVAPLRTYARNEQSWETVTAVLANSLRDRFSQRLTCARRLHQLMFSPLGGKAMQLLLRSQPIWRASFALTR